MPASAIDAIVAAILGEAKEAGGATFNKIKGALAFHARTYAQFLEDIAKGVKKGEIAVADAAEAVRSAQLMLSISVKSQVKQITLAQVQNFLNAVIGAARGAINAALPLPLL
jgi:hypothetical protein